MRRLTSGAILLVKNGPLDKEVGRRNLMAYVSDDEGETWKGGLKITGDDVDGAYPDGDQGPDGTIYLTWDRHRTNTGDVHFARFREEDVRNGVLLVDGRKSSPDSTLDGMIMERQVPTLKFDGRINIATSGTTIFLSRLCRVTGRTLNVIGRYDGLNVELFDACLSPPVGFSSAGSSESDGNGESSIVWENGRDLSELLGRDVYIRFVLKNGRLDAFRFQD